MADLPAELDFKKNPAASPDRMNQATEHLHGRLKSLEIPARTFEQLLAELQAIGLQRINEALQPYYLQLAESVTDYIALIAAQTIDGGTYAVSGTRINLRRSSVAGQVPASLNAGEIAINEADGLLHWKDDAGVIRATPLLGLALLASPAFTGVPTTTTPAAGDNSARISSTAFVQSTVSTAVAAAIASLVNSSPAALDTLKELADALGNDASFSATVTTALANRLRVDAAQSLSSGQTQQALTNLGVSAFIRTLLDDADAATARTTLGAQQALGFTPVQQGTGVGQSTNTVKVGHSTIGPKITVDSTDYGRVWTDVVAHQSAGRADSFDLILPTGIFVQTRLQSLMFDDGWASYTYPASVSTIIAVMACNGNTSAVNGLIIGVDFPLGTASCTIRATNYDGSSFSGAAGIVISVWGVY